jgi:hypothetical protein
MLQRIVGSDSDRYLMAEELYPVDSAVKKVMMTASKVD